MDIKVKAEELFEVVIGKRKTILEILFHCSQGELGTLLYLTFIEDGITPTKLGEKLNVSMPRVLSILNSLESKKLISKKKCQQDKRKSILYITSLGKEMILQERDSTINQLTKIIEKLEEKEIDEYIRIVKKIGTILENMESL